MDPDLESELQKSGENLRASHDDEVIEDVIAEVEDLEDETAEETAELLRMMVDID